MESVVVQEANRALASWALGDTTSEQTLATLCGTLEGAEITCGFVRSHGASVQVHTTPRGCPFTTLLSRGFALANARRLLVKPTDASWRELGAEPSAAVWLASEPAVPGPGLVVGGDLAFVAFGRGGASMEDALPLLPRLARAGAAVLARDGEVDAAGKAVHALNNHLAAISGNVEYAHELLTDEVVSGPAAREDLATAIAHTRRSLQSLHVLVAQLKSERAGKRR